MWILYLDEIGTDGRYVPGQQGTSPVFGLGGFAIEHNRLRSLVGHYFRMKRRFFRKEYRAWCSEVKALPTAEPTSNPSQWRAEKRRLGLVALSPDQWGRIERFEIKGNWLASAGSLRRTSRNPKTKFATRLLRQLSDHGCFLFAAVQVKPPNYAAHDRTALYGSLTQAILKGYDRFLEKNGDQASTGTVVMDERERNLNCSLLASAQSYLFSKGLLNITDTPYLVDSRWYPGVQIADNVNGVLHSLFRTRFGGAAGAAYESAEALFGSDVDALNWVDGDWTSIYVRK